MSNVLNPAGVVHSFTDMLRPVASAGKGRPATPTEIREAARIEGYDRGYQEGAAQAQLDIQLQQEALISSLADHIAAVQGLLHRLDEEFSAALDDWSMAMAGPVAELSLVVAARMVGEALRADPQVAVEMAKQALREVTHAVDARVKVNPIDATVLRQAMPELMGASLSLRHIEVVDEPHIEAGCRVETDGGVVDATISTMIEQARLAMRMEQS